MRSEEEAVAGEEAPHTCSTPDCLITRRISLPPLLNLGVNPGNSQTRGQEASCQLNELKWLMCLKGDRVEKIGAR